MVLVTVLGLFAVNELPRPAYAQSRHLTKAPVLRQFVAPTRPQSDSGSTSTEAVEVVVSLLVDAAGEVRDVKIVSAEYPEFGAAVQAAARQFKYEPAEFDGKPNAIRFTYRYVFPELPPVIKASSPIERAPAPVTTLSVAKAPDAPTAPDAPKLPAAPADPEPEIVNARGSKSSVAGSSVVTMDATARATPGAMGDGLAIVQNLPSVARPPSGSNQIVVWGAAPADTGIYIDDVPIPYLYHYGGTRSVFNSALVSSLELTPVGYQAAFGGRTGGLLRIRSNPLTDPDTHGYAALDFLDGSGALRASSGAWSVAVGGRMSLLDSLLPLVAPDAASRFPLSRYADGVAKVVYRGPDGISELSVYGSNDDLDRTLAASSGEARKRSEVSRQNFTRVMLRHTWSGGSIQVWGGRDLSQRRLVFDGPSAQVQSETWRAGMRAQRTIHPATNVLIRLGTELGWNAFELDRTGTLALPAREGDAVVYGQAPSRRVATEQWASDQFTLAPFIEADWTPLSQVRISPGMRLETLGTAGTRTLPRTGAGVDNGYSTIETPLDPRLTVAAKLSRRMTLQSSFGRYHQQPDAVDGSAIFGTPGLPPSVAWHGIVGGVWQARDAVVAEWSVFGKSQEDLAVRSDAVTPILGHSLDPVGQGRAFGMQATLRVNEVHKFSGWLTYSLTRAERRDSAASPWRKFDYDQPHALTAVVAYKPLDRLTLSGRVRIASGYPRAKVVGAYDDGSSFQPIRSGTERLPLFATLDVHAEYSGRLSAKVKWTAYLDIINVLNRKNAEEFVYRFDYQQRSVLSGFPLLAFAGLRIER